MVAKSKSVMMKRLRAQRKAAGSCPYCGQPIPKPANEEEVKA
jgi:DNA repair exonuclease SbcCD ATPase subunit